ncbi:MAG: DUF6612 family protein, partial [Halobacteria archaeon]|nr:DUF6612 family protein [Halobacteria archaeon]
GASQPTNTEIYVVNNTTYIKGRLPGQDGWVKASMPSIINEMWNTQNQLEKQEELLNISEVERLEDDTVRGTQTYVLRIKPDADEYQELVEEQLSGMGPAGSLARESVEVQSVSAKQWIAKDTNYPMRSQVELSMVMTTPGSGGRTVRSNVSIEMKLYDHNKNVEIELPEEARNARSFSDEFGNRSFGSIGGSGSGTAG